METNCLQVGAGESLQGNRWERESQRGGKDNEGWEEGEGNIRKRGKEGALHAPRRVDAPLGGLSTSFKGGGRPCIFIFF